MLMMIGKNPELKNDAKIYVAVKDCRRKCGRILLRKGTEIVLDQRSMRNNNTRRWIRSGSLQPKGDF